MKNETYIGVMFCNNEELIQPWFFHAKMAMRKSRQFGILAMDNGSGDDTYNFIEMYHDEFADGRIYKPKNVGIACGRNDLIEFGKEINDQKHVNIFLLDSDLFITRHNSFLAMESMMRETGAGVVFGTQFAFDPKREGFEKKEDGYSFCLISGDVFEKYGLFDEQFENYYDDTDFHMRMKKNNVKTVCCPDAIGVHYWGLTTALGSEGAKRAERLESDRQKFKNKWENQSGL